MAYRQNSDTSVNRLTPKQEAFVLAYIEIGNASEAYRQAYNPKRMKASTIHEAASRLLANSKVAARVQQLQAKAAEKTLVTVETLVAELEEARKIAKANRQSAAMVSATVAKGKLLGLVVEKQEHAGKISVTAEDDVSLARRLAFILHKAERATTKPETN